MLRRLVPVRQIGIRAFEIEHAERLRSSSARECDLPRLAERARHMIGAHAIAFGEAWNLDLGIIVDRRDQNLESVKMAEAAASAAGAIVSARTSLRS